MNYYGQYNYNNNNTPPLSPVGGTAVDAVWAERYRVKRAGNAVGAALLIQTVAATVMQYAFFAVCMFLGYSYQGAYDILTSAPYFWLFQGFASAFSIVLAFGVGARIYGMKLKECVALSRPESRGESLPLVLTFCGAVTAANLMSSQLLSLVGYEGSAIDEVFSDYPEGVFGTLLVLLVVGVIPALVEEFAYRGVVLGVLRNVSDGFAIFASALIFGIMHGNISQIPFAFVLGLMLGYITVKTGSVWPAVVCHALNNSVSVVLDILTSRLSEESGSMLLLIYFAAMAIIGLLGFILSVKRGVGFSTPKSGCVLRAKTRLRIFLTAPCMVIYLIIILLQIILMEAAVL